MLLRGKKLLYIVVICEILFGMNTNNITPLVGTSRVEVENPTLEVPPRSTLPIDEVQLTGSPTWFSVDDDIAVRMGTSSQLVCDDPRCVLPRSDSVNVGINNSSVSGVVSTVGLPISTAYVDRRPRPSTSSTLPYPQGSVYETEPRVSRSGSHHSAFSEVPPRTRQVFGQSPLGVEVDREVQNYMSRAASEASRDSRISHRSRASRTDRNTPIDALASLCHNLIAETVREKDEMRREKFEIMSNLKQEAQEREIQIQRNTLDFSSALAKEQTKSALLQQKLQFMQEKHELEKGTTVQVCRSTHDIPGTGNSFPAPASFQTELFRKDNSVSQYGANTASNFYFPQVDGNNLPLPEIDTQVGPGLRHGLVPPLGTSVMDPGVRNPFHFPLPPTLPYQSVLPGVSTCYYQPSLTDVAISSSQSAKTVASHSPCVAATCQSPLMAVSTRQSMSTNVTPCQSGGYSVSPNLIRLTPALTTDSLSVTKGGLHPLPIQATVFRTDSFAANNYSLQSNVSVPSSIVVGGQASLGPAHPSLVPYLNHLASNPVGGSGFSSTWCTTSVPPSAFMASQSSLICSTANSNSLLGVVTTSPSVVHSGLYSLAGQTLTMTTTSDHKSVFPCILTDANPVVTAYATQVSNASAPAVNTETTVSIVQTAAEAAVVPASTLTLSCPNTSTAVTSTVSTTTPLIVVRQLQTVRPFNGSTSWKAFREHFRRVAKVNGWDTEDIQLQQLCLSLEGAAADLLRGFDETAPSALDGLWKKIEHRFGDLDSAREAMRRFDSRRQADSETISEYEQALRLLFHEAWPNASPQSKDAALKRKFEDSVYFTELSQYLRLHTRDLTFDATVDRARIFMSTVESTKPKKSVRIVTSDRTETVPETSAADLQPLLTCLEDINNKLDNLPQCIDASRPSSGPQTFTNTSHPDPPGNPGAVRTGQQFSARRGQANQSSVNTGSSRYNNGRSANRRSRFIRQQEQSPTPTTPPPRVNQSTSPFQYGQAGRQSGTYGVRGTSRRPPGCYSCGRPGCHSDICPQGVNNNPQRQPQQPTTPTSTTESRSSTTPLNANWSPRTGNRTPTSVNRPQSH